MDNLIKHWASHPRSFPSPLQVQSIGHIPEKSSWIDTAFSTMNFSFILRGTGEYWLDGRCWKIEAPCAMIQIPDKEHRYGPSPEKATWEELYVIYTAKTYREFRNMRYVDPERPVWPVYSREWLCTQLETINFQLGRRKEQGRADWLDRTLQSLILESLLALDPPELSSEDAAIEKARDQLQQNPGQPVDWNDMAHSAGMSLPTFRRHWNRRMEMPPSTYLTRLRIREARRLLVETNRSIGQIAALVGLEDPLYFSRLFRKETGTTASAYRKSFRMSPRPARA